jgi:hypothetical protein
MPTGVLGRAPSSFSAHEFDVYRVQTPGADTVNQTVRPSGVGKLEASGIQLVQDAAARLVTGLRKFDHVLPTPRDLHWLPVRQRINCKVAHSRCWSTNVCAVWHRRILPTTADLCQL